MSQAKIKFLSWFMGSLT